MMPLLKMPEHLTLHSNLRGAYSEDPLEGGSVIRE